MSAWRRSIGPLLMTLGVGFALLHFFHATGDLEDPRWFYAGVAAALLGWAADASQSRGSR